MRIIFVFACAVFLFSCSKKNDDAPSTPSGKLQGLHKYYFPDGKIYLEINYKDSLPHGSVKRYYKAGGLLEESEYKNGVLHGLMRTYHENGKLSSETPYDSGRVNGIKKKFRKDGTPAYEAPYYLDQPCIGLKEYFLSGKRIDNYPRVVINPRDELLKDDRYILEFSLSDGSHAVEFYRGPLTDGKYLSDDASPVHTANGVAKIYYSLPPGGFVMETVRVVAKIKTDLGNYYLKEVSYNVAIQNR